MQRQVVIQVTDDMLKQMLRAPLVRSVARRAAIGLVVVVVVTALLCWRKGMGAIGMTLWPAAAGLAMVLLACVDFRRIRRAAMAPYQKLRDRGITYRFTDDALEIGTIDNYSICRWKDVIRVRKYRYAWCLYFGPVQFVVLPLDAVDDELEEFIRSATRRR